MFSPIPHIRGTGVKQGIATYNLRAAPLVVTGEDVVIVVST